MSESRRRILARVETVSAMIAGALAALTIFWRDWIEGLTGWDPDHHNGSFEVLIVIGLALLAVVLGLLARRTWHSLSVAEP